MIVQMLNFLFDFFNNFICLFNVGLQKPIISKVRFTLNLDHRLYFLSRFSVFVFIIIVRIICFENVLLFFGVIYVEWVLHYFTCFSLVPVFVTLAKSLVESSDHHSRIICPFLILKGLGNSFMLSVDLPIKLNERQLHFVWHLMEVVVLGRVYINRPSCKQLRPLAHWEFASIMSIENCERRGMPHNSVTWSEESFALNLRQMRPRSDRVNEFIVLLLAS